jgi:hypothetical protein
MHINKYILVYTQTHTHTHTYTHTHTHTHTQTHTHTHTNTQDISLLRRSALYHAALILLSISCVKARYANIAERVKAHQSVLSGHAAQI